MAMKLVTDPSIAVKIQKMKQRVRWQEASLTERGIDQTRLVIDDGHSDDPAFSFLVIGDSGSGPHRGHNPQRQIAEQMLQHRDSRFVLHTGDVIYLTGSSDFYPKNFIEPYREWLVGGEQGLAIAYDRMVFTQPFLPVLGNHDYYDLPLVYGVLAQVTAPLRRLLAAQLDLDIGWRGSSQGQAYAKAFLDYLIAQGQGDGLNRHLEQHYNAEVETGRCLRYQPSQFTRLPNRYYTFRYGGIDFFALDSNTFNEPAPLPSGQRGSDRRRELEQRRAKLEQEKQEIRERAAKLNGQNPEEAEQLDDLRAKLEQLEELQLDIDKQLNPDQVLAIDHEQLDWLRQRLVESWKTEGVRGRVLFFHHPPYVTEATKWHQAQTLAVRRHLREVFDGVAGEVNSLRQGRPIVDLVLNGHAHCLEYLRTVETGHADAHTNWIVCGGSGFSLRRQREEGPELVDAIPGGQEIPVAHSKLFVGRTGQGSQKRRPYSFLRIDVEPGTPPRFVVRPFVAERFQRQWKQYALDPLIL